MPSRCLSLLVLVGVALTGERAFAWGERGHDLVARVAARLIIERSPRGDSYAAVFEQKEHMLGHLANVPDIVWRNVGPEIEAQNAPTHYVDLEFFDLKPAFATAPKTKAEAEARIISLCAKPPAGYLCPVQPGEKPRAELAGIAPFRIEQLFDLMAAALAKAKGASSKDRIAAVDSALLYGGVMAHFVGDLGNPWHGTRDYNGFETGQGGIHKYFEEELVNALPLSLDEDVIAEALRNKPFQHVLEQMPAGERATRGKDPLSVAWALTFDSAKHLDESRALDKKVALLKPSSMEKGLRIKAERRDPRDVRGEFRELLIDRLATAADTLATLWLAAYEKAGKPSLKGFASYHYDLAPAFIPAP